MGIVATAPTPFLEVPKQVALCAADYALCLKIYDAYFDDVIKKKL